MNKNDPAFPLIGDYSQIKQKGMTLRDYFAAKAMPWVAYDLQVNEDFYARVAQHSYEIADAMLKAREL